MSAPALPEALLAAWRDLTPRHQALVLALIEALAAEDRARAQHPDAERVPDGRAAAIDALAMRGPAPTPEPDAWLHSVGMFSDNAVMDAIWEAGSRIRAAERDPPSVPPEPEPSPHLAAER